MSATPERQDQPFVFPLRRGREGRYPETPLGTPGDAGAPVESSSLWRDAWYRYVRNRAAVIAGAVFLLLLAYCLVWPIVSPYDPYEVDFSQRSEGPSLEHPFGTDQFGRDLFTRTALGGRVSIGIGFAATIVILAIGVAYGSIAGFLGGVSRQRADAVPRRAVRAPLPAVRDHRRSRSSAAGPSGRW